MTSPVFSVLVIYEVEDGYSKKRYTNLISALTDAMKLSQDQHHKLVNVITGFQLENDITAIEKGESIYET